MSYSWHYDCTEVINIQYKMYFLFWVFTFPWAGKTQCDNFSWCWVALLKWVTDSSQPWSHSKSSISSVCHLPKMFPSLGVFKSIFHLGHFNLHWISGFYFIFLQLFDLVSVAVTEQHDRYIWLPFLVTIHQWGKSGQEPRQEPHRNTVSWLDLCGSLS